MASISSTIGDIFNSVQTSLISFFSPQVQKPSPTVTVTTPVISQKVTDIATISDTLSTTTVNSDIQALRDQVNSLAGKISVIGSAPARTVTTTKPTIIYQQTSSGVTSSDLATKLNQLDNKLTALIYANASHGAAVDAGNYRAISLSNRIDSLNGVTITNATISGTFTGGGTISGYLPLGGGTLTGTTTGTGAIFTGLVGIGTTSPEHALDVAGDINITGSLLQNGVAAVFSNWTVNGSNIYRNSNVGIGTSSPYAPLSVMGEVVASSFTATSTTATSTFATGGLNIGSGQFIVQSSSGRIGIGTSTPATSLDIYATDAVHLPIGTTAQRPGMALAGQIRYNTTTHQFEGFGDNSVWQGLGGVINAAQTTYITAGDDDFLRFVTASAERMTITDTGLVGIGTTSPYAKLSVSGNTSDLDLIAPLFLISSSTDIATTTNFVVTRGGNVGIGTESPTAGLDVYGKDIKIFRGYGGTSLPSYLADDRATFSYNYVIDYPSAGRYARVLDIVAAKQAEDNGDTVPTAIRFLTTPRDMFATPQTSMVIEGTAGNVGIGTSTPYAKLSVDGISAGTLIAGDALTGFSGLLLDLKVASSTKFSVNYLGDIFTLGSTTLQNFTASIGTTSVLAITSTTATSTFSTGGLTVGTSQFVVQQNSGNVGIGTSSPVYPVSVAQKTIALNSGNDGTLGAWTTSSSLGTTRYQQTSVAANGYVYAIGGYNGTRLSSVEYAKINSNGTLGAWTTTSSLTITRYQHSSIAANGYVYAIGGNGTGGVQVNTVEYAKINSDGTLGAWKTTASLNITRYAHASVVSNGYVYVMGGRTGISDTATVEYAKINSDGTLGTWTTLTATPLNAARNIHASVVVGGYIYTIGGITSGTSISSVESAKINSDGTLAAWTTLTATPLNTARGALSAVVANGYLYAMGGIGGGNLSSIEYAKIYANGTLGAWTTLTATPFSGAREYHTSLVVNGYVYAIAGTNDGGTTALSSVEYSSLARTMLAGTLDMIGFAYSSSTLAEADSGASSIYSGDIFSSGNVEVAGNTRLWNSLNVNGFFSLNATTSRSQSISIFSLQNATSSAPIFTSFYNGLIGMGTSTPYARLSIEHLSSSGTVIGADSLSTFTGTLLDLKVASSTKFSVNYLGDIFTLGSTTLQNFTFANATGTNATTTNLAVTGTASTSALIVSDNSTVGGTLSLTALTSGSVPYIGANGAVSQNNSIMYFDSINSRLAIGSTPANVQIPTFLTSDSAPSPYVASASTEVNCSAWQSFDSDSSTAWCVNGTSGWLKIDLGTYTTVNQYKIQADSYTTYYTYGPKTWTFEGSNDNSAWTVLNTQTNVPAWSSGEIRTYALGTAQNYRYYKLNISASQSDWIFIGSLVLGNTATSHATPLAKLHVSTAEVGEKGLIVQGITSQTADLQEWQNGSGTVLGAVTAEGLLGIGTSSPYALLSVEKLSTTGTVIGTDALAGFSGMLLDMKVASSTKFSVNYLGDIFTLGSTTLQNFTFANATGTNATTTNLAVTGIASTSALIVSGNATFSSYTSGFASLTSTGGLYSTATSSLLTTLNLTKGFLLVGNDAGVAQATSSIYISSTGNVGIGTTSPYAKVTIWGTATSSGRAFEVTDSASTTLFSIDNTGSTTIAQLITGSQSFEADAGLIDWINMPLASTTLASGTELGFSAGIGATSTLTVYALADGTGSSYSDRVGVGTTSPSAKFAVNGFGTNDTGRLFAFADFANNERLTLLNNGLLTATNILLTGSTTLQNFTFVNATGTNATTTNLAVTGTASTSALVVSGDTSVGGTFSVTGATTLSGTLAVTGQATFTNASTTQLSVNDQSWFGGTATTTITSAGLVGIGVVTPAYSLDVNAVGSTPSATDNQGTVTTYTSGGQTYRVHTFTNTGSVTFTVPSSGVTSVKVLVVAGGGGGGKNGVTSWVDGGGGGGGGVVGGGPSNGYSYAVTPSQSITVVVGAGGAGATGSTNTNGGDSQFGTVVATGGGKGGSQAFTWAGSDGGSGGGAASAGSQSGGNGTSGQGYNGGGAAQNNGGGGGGGAGATGSNGSDAAAGVGGIGTTTAISDGVTTVYYGGGGGGSSDLQSGGSGGLGGGGAGGTSGAGTAGTTNSGGGGGGATEGGAGGGGGSGIVIVSYPITNPNGVAANFAGGVLIGSSGTNANLTTTGTTSTSVLTVNGNATTTSTGQFTTNGFVGIGTTSPFAKLSIQGNTTDSSANMATPLFVVASSTASATNSLFTILRSGYVGIGTTTPLALLDIYGSSTVPTRTATGQLLIRSNNSQAVDTGGSIAFGGYKDDVPLIPSSIRNFASIVGFKENSTTNNQLGYLAFSTNNSTAMTEAMRITSGGLVGIGTTTPWAKLSVSANTSDSNVDGTQPIFTVASSTLTATTTSFTVLRNGNVGIGTTTPAYLLNIANIAPMFYLSDTDAVSGLHHRYIQSSNGTMFFGKGSDSYSNTDQVMIDTNGNVGIATTTPWAKLSIHEGTRGNPQIVLDNLGAGVAGQYAKITFNDAGDNSLDFQTNYSAGTGNYISFSPANAEKMRIQQNGNVGIGTTSPSAKLEILDGGTAATQLLKITGDDDSPYGLVIGNNTFSAAAATGLSIYTSNAGKAFLDARGTGATMGLAVQGSEKLSITNAGNVGIGTTTPNYKLSVNGVISPVSETATDRVKLMEFGNQQGTTQKQLQVTMSNASNVFEFQGIQQNTGYNQNIAFQAQGGNVGIGTTTPGAKLEVYGTGTGSGLCVSTSSATVACSSVPAGQIYSRGASTQTVDLAESYKITDETISAGDLVSLDTSTSTLVVRKASSTIIPVIGIISTDPGVLLGGASSEFTASTSRPVALSGRVPTKVNLEGGDIAVGDYITLSSAAGIGMKATTSGQTVGIALEPWSGTLPDGSYSQTGSITVFVNLGYQNISSGIADGAVSSDWVVDQSTGYMKLATARVLDLQGQAIVNIKSLASASGNWSLDENGRLVVQDLNVLKSMKVGSSVNPIGVTLYDDTTGNPYCLKVSSGLVASVAGECVAGTAPAGAPAGTSTPPADTEAPVITMLGLNPSTINMGSSYSDMGATVTDNVDHNLGIVTTGDQIDTTLAGTHEVKYNAVDNSGNNAIEQIRIVNVIDPNATSTTP
ncbi:MAG: glycine-rich domain-containing protein [Candidatus Paceibacterota bacterium]